MMSQKTRIQRASEHRIFTLSEMVVGKINPLGERTKRCLFARTLERASPILPTSRFELEISPNLSLAFGEPKIIVQHCQHILKNI